MKPFTFSSKKNKILYIKLVQNLFLYYKKYIYIYIYIKLKNITVATHKNKGYYNILEESCKRNNIELII